MYASAVDTVKSSGLGCGGICTVAELAAKLKLPSALLAKKLRLRGVGTVDFGIGPERRLIRVADLFARGRAAK